MTNKKRPSIFHSSAPGGHSPSVSTFKYHASRAGPHPGPHGKPPRFLNSKSRRSHLLSSGTARCTPEGHRFPPGHPHVGHTVEERAFRIRFSGMTSHSLLEPQHVFGTNLSNTGISLTCPSCVIHAASSPGARATKTEGHRICDDVVVNKIENKKTLSDGKETLDEAQRVIKGRGKGRGAQEDSDLNHVQARRTVDGGTTERHTAAFDKHDQVGSIDPEQTADRPQINP